MALHRIRRGEIGKSLQGNMLKSGTPLAQFRSSHLTSGFTQRVPVLRQRRSGFTLVETLVVILIIGVVTAFAAPSLIRIGNNSNLRAARGALITAVNVAKSAALTTGKCSFMKINNNAVSVFTTSCPGGAQTEIVSNRNFGTDYSVTLAIKKNGTCGSGTDAAVDSLGFDPRGVPVDHSQCTTFTITKAGSTRTVQVGFYGSVQ